jgi:tetratricopeptide (TPR) repeat protein
MGKDESMKKSFILWVIITVFMLSIWSCKETPPEPVTQGGSKPVASVHEDSEKQHQTPGALQKKPESLEEFVKLGNTNMDSGRYDEAIKYYTKALDIRPENVNIRTDMGTCYRRIGRPDRAVEEYKKSLTFQPEHTNTLANLGIVLAYDINDIDGAVKTWEKYLQSASPGRRTDMIFSKLQVLKSAQAAKKTP